jgi:hypothetical protein
MIYFKKISQQRAENSSSTPIKLNPTTYFSQHVSYPTKQPIITYNKNPLTHTTIVSTSASHYIFAQTK